MSLLELDAVNSYYGQSHILRDVSMRVEEGEICALLGRNGAGKTTTLRSIAGSRPPDVRQGRISYKGRDITDMAAEDISMLGVSIVPEERRVFGNLTVEENLHIADVAMNRSNTWNREVQFAHEGQSMEQILADFPRLDERQNQLAGTLSGGEQQMLAIARALKQQTDVLMLDEPYEGLAPQIIKTVENAVKRIKDEGTTVLLVEQNAVAAMKIADRCYVIDQGTVVFEGSAEELRNDQETRDRYLGV